MRFSIAPSLSILGLLAACSSRPLTLDDEAGTTTSPGTTAGESTVGESTSVGTTDTHAEEGGFGICDFGGAWQCDPFAQDCPAGEKCVSASSDGHDYDLHICVPVLGAQQPGESCEYDGWLAATDDCDATSQCWTPGGLDGAAGPGICRPFCMGVSDAPLCPMGTYCPIWEFSPVICLPPCDPLVQDCGEGLGCYWLGTGFTCVATTENHPAGEPCAFVNDCALGHVCVYADDLPRCAGTACCTHYCDLAVGDADCVAQPGTACTALFTESTAPADYEKVGACILPP